MLRQLEAYLDIETTGLSSSCCEITVIGINICHDSNARFTQLVSKDITAANLLETLKGVSIIYTYNGSRFDLPFIDHRLGINLAEYFEHRDLMYDCWQNNCYGGFKRVEKQLGIKRRLKEVDGLEAIKLWWQYMDYFDLDALNLLLEYNKEDVLNLKILKEILVEI